MTYPDSRPSVINTQLDQFLLEKRPGARRWLETPTLAVYVRRGFHFDGVSEVLSTLDIANVTAFPKSRGIFTGFLEHAENVSTDPIYIENVLEERFCRFFEKRGYLLIPRTNPSCFILHK